MPEKLVRVKFLKTRTVKDAEGLCFKEGKVYELSPNSAERWIRRGVAEECSGKTKAAKPDAAGPPPTTRGDTVSRKIEGPDMTGKQPDRETLADPEKS